MSVAAPWRAAGPGHARDGGTLRLFGPGEVEPDPVAPQHARALARLTTRQLLTYAPCDDPRAWQAIAPVADVARDVPSTYNAGLGASHRCYVVHLRPGVAWDSDPVRPVTAGDFVRGFKRMCNPVVRPRQLTYFTSTIRGMASFCAGYEEAVAGRPAARELAAYERSHEIPGVFALDDATLVIEALRPTPELVALLALPCASAAPVEYEAFVPGSAELRRNARSNGPYRIVRDGKRVVLERNPAWRCESDPVRRAHVDRIEIVRAPGAGPAEISAAIDAGGADLGWTAARRAPCDDRDAVCAASPRALDPYLVFNVADGAAAVRDVRVRRAIAAAIDVGALAGLCAGGGRALAAGGIVPPSGDRVAGADARPPAPPDPDRARSLLADAGCAGDLTLTVAWHAGDEPALAHACAADLRAAGIAVRLVVLDDEAYRRALRPARGEQRGWDVVACSWSPDWLHRNARSFLQPLLETAASANHGGYSSPRVDALVARALEAAVEPRAALDAAWRAVERAALDDAAVVPLLFRAPAGSQRRAARVRGAVALPAAGYAPDLAALWLDGGAPSPGD